MSARTIWKFPLDMVERQTLEVGNEPRIVHVADAPGSVLAWIEHEPRLDTERVRLLVWIVGTGQPVPQLGTYAGTFMPEGTPFVFHVYAAPEPAAPDLAVAS